MDMDEIRSDPGSGTGPLRRVRRRTAGLKRSRTGCGTCKRRGKKCDEEWNQDGWCQRCVLGDFECTGRTQVQCSTATITTTTTTTTALSEDRSTATLSPQEEPLTIPVAIPTSDDSHLTSPTTTLGSQSISFTPSTIPSATSFTTHAPSTLPALQNSSHGTYPYTYPQYHQTQQQQQQHQTWSGPGFSSSALATFLPTSNNQNPYDPSALASTSTSTLDTSTLTWNNSTYALTNNFSPLEGNTNIWNDFAFSFINSSPGQTITSDSTTSTSVYTTTAINHDLGVDNSRVGVGVGGGDPHLVFMNGDKPMRQGVSLAEIYARVVESWLIGLPSTTRDYARARILALNDNNSVLRNVRYAVATAYIFLFASDHKGGKNKDPEPQPKLVEMAWKGAGIVDGQSRTNDITAVAVEPVAGASKKGKNGRKGQNNRASVRSGEDDGKAQTSNKIKIYVDHVSTPFAADLESKKWTEDAVRELREVIVTDQAQLSNLLWGVIDLQLVEFIRGGAAPSYNMLALGDRLVRSAMGDNHPPITLRRLRTSDTLSLRFYALSDISRCIVQRGRKTIFNFWTDVGDMDDASIAENGDDEPWATYLGLPDSIVILLAEVVNLCAELSCSSSVSIKQQADELESALRGWQSQTFTTGGAGGSGSVDSSALVSRTIAGELWRLSALILLYQSVHKVGGLHPILRRSTKEILNLLDSIVRLPNGDLWGFIALPAFLAACLSISENDRKRAMGHLYRPGPERVWLDNIALVEKLWEEVDETGRLPDWYDKMTREGLSVAFF